MVSACSIRVSGTHVYSTGALYIQHLRRCYLVYAVRIYCTRSAHYTSATARAIYLWRGATVYLARGAQVLLLARALVLHTARIYTRTEHYTMRRHAHSSARAACGKRERRDL